MHTYTTHESIEHNHEPRAKVLGNYYAYFTLIKATVKGAKFLTSLSSKFVM